MYNRRHYYGYTLYGKCLLKNRYTGNSKSMGLFKKYLPENPTDEDYEKLPSKASLNIYPLPSYEFIDHKSIMSEFVKNIWDDKQTRQELFYILRNHDYMDKFYDS